MMGREEAIVEERSQCSSGCPSGWTLYLEHSGSGHQQCCSLPYYHPDASDEEACADSMVSDASSGPAPQHQLSEGEELQVEGSREMRRCSFGDHCYYSRRTGRRSSASGSSASRSFGSTRTGSLGDVKSGTKRRAAVVQGKEEAMRQRRHGAIVDDDDDLHDTASSSAIATTVDVVEATYSGGDAMNLHPIGAFLVKHAFFSGIASGYQHEHAGLCNATP